MNEHNDRQEQINRDEMPEDYRPQKRMEFMAIYLEHKQGVEMLTDEEAGRVFKRMFQLAEDYSESYDDSLRIDTDDLSPMASYIANIIGGGVKRSEDNRRHNSYARSGVNGGGRPKKT